MHKLKVSSSILLGTLLRTKTQNTASQRVLRNSYREIRKDSRYIGILAGEKKTKTKNLWWNTSRLLLTIIKKAKTKQASQGNDINTFLHLARYKSQLTEIIPLICIIDTGAMYLVFSIMNPLRVHHQVLMASWLATFIVYQSVRQYFSSARTNFHHFSNIKIFASLVFFRTFVSFPFSFFFLLYPSSLSTVQWKFYFHFHFLYWFSLKFI